MAGILYIEKYEKSTPAAIDTPAGVVRERYRGDYLSTSSSAPLRCKLDGVHPAHPILVLTTTRNGNILQPRLQLGKQRVERPVAPLSGLERSPRMRAILARVGTNCVQNLCRALNRNGLARCGR